MERNFPISKFFYNLLHTKRPNIKTATDKEMLVYIIKFYTGDWFFKLGNKYFQFITRLTRYFPLSLILQDRIYHAKNLPVKKLMRHLEAQAEKAKLETILIRGEDSDKLVELNGFFAREKDDNSENIEILETIFQKKFETIYIRSEEEGFKVLIHRESFTKIIS